MLMRWHAPVATVMTVNIQEEQDDEEGLHLLTPPEAQGDPVMDCALVLGLVKSKPKFSLIYPAELSP